MVKVNSDPTPGEGTIWFDYFLTKDPTIRSNTSQKARVRDIVGGTVGGVAALLLIILGVSFFRRRKLKARQSQHVQPVFWSKDGSDVQPSSGNTFWQLYVSPFHSYLIK